MVIKPEPHPFRWHVPAGARTLIIGTFPPVRSRWSFEFFYPNARNVFWKILAAVAGRPLDDDMDNAIEQRKALLEALGAGITDMGGVIERMAGNSLDENLKLIEYMPILDILDEHPTIKQILLTSSSGKVSSLAWFKLYLLKNGIDCIVPKGPKPLQFEISYSGRRIDVFVLYSPSPRASNRISYPNLVDMYRKVLQ